LFLHWQESYAFCVREKSAPTSTSEVAESSARKRKADEKN
jgi:hypothetical protein